MATSGGEEVAAAAPAPGAPATGADTTPGWEVAVRPLLSASYSAFEMKELPQLVASVIERYRAAAPEGRAWGGGGGGELVRDPREPLFRPPSAAQGPRSQPRLGAPGPWEARACLRLLWPAHVNLLCLDVLPEQNF